MSEVWATVNDLAELYKLHPNTVRNKARSEEWPSERIGKVYRFSPEQQAEIDRIIRSGSQ